MTLQQELLAGRDRLTTVSESPFLDATLLMSHALGISREKVLAAFPEELRDSQRSRFQELLEQRLSGLPLAYITGTKEFWGLTFQVGPEVLTPRPDTEVLVETARETAAAHGWKRIHDLCTGSGCIALALKHSCPGWEVSASDISAPALKRARQNARILLGSTQGTGAQAPVIFTKTSLLDGLPGPFDLIVSNPPYLTSAEMTEKEAQKWPEPHSALDGGADGLDLIRMIIRQSPGRLREGGGLLMEADYRQMDAIEKLLKADGWRNIIRRPDLTGRIRVIGGYRP